MEDKGRDTMKKKLVSACFAGIHCRYDGKHNRVEQIQELIKRGEAVPVCPEQLGGLSTPRKPAEIVGGDGHDVLDGKAKVVTVDGEDVTEAFVRGAYEALRVAQMLGVEEAVLKEKSPSCGNCIIYDGTFQGVKKAGQGVTAALLKRHGIKVVSEEEWKQES
jgi:uncharacterized protein YbbK (DUF523 family)